MHSDSNARRREADFRYAGLSYVLSPAGGTSGSFARDVAIKLARVYHRDRWRYSPRRFGSWVDRIRIDRPIFVLGMAGSGGTIIGRCLRRNHTVVSMSGSSEYWTGIDELGVVRNRMRKLPPVAWGHKYRFDVVRPGAGTQHAYACDDLLPFYRRTGREATAADGARFKRLIREHIAVYGRDRRNGRWLDKTHAFTVKIPLLASFLAGTQPHFVVVVRNPYAACLWAVERKPTFFPPSLSIADRLRVMAEHWHNSYRIAVADAEHVPNVAFVRFEDFLADPAAVVRAISDFVGLDFDEEMVPQAGQTRPFATLPGDRKWYPIYADTWLQGCDAGSRAVIDARCSGLLERFGYSREGARARPELIETARLGATQRLLSI